jgi:hypothetical protein
MKTKPSRKWNLGLSKWMGALVILCKLTAAGPAEAKEANPDRILPFEISVTSGNEAKRKNPTLGLIKSVFGPVKNGLVIWTPEEREPSGRRLYLKPLLLTDAAGKLTPGVGLKLVDW